MSASFSFFSKPKAMKPAGSGTTVAVRTVVKRVPPPTAAQGSAEGRIKVVAREATPASSVSSGSKRKLEVSTVPREVKKLRRRGRAGTFEMGFFRSASLSCVSLSCAGSSCLCTRRNDGVEWFPKRMMDERDDPALAVRMVC